MSSRKTAWHAFAQTALRAIEIIGSRNSVLVSACMLAAVFGAVPGLGNMAWAATEREESGYLSSVSLVDEPPAARALTLTDLQSLAARKKQIADLLMSIDSIASPHGGQGRAFLDELVREFLDLEQRIKVLKESEPTQEPLKAIDDRETGA